jgi:hypothetical protein
VDRTLLASVVVFIAPAVVGAFLALSPSTLSSAQSDMDGLRAIGAALFAGGLAAFLVEAFSWDRARHA